MGLRARTQEVALVSSLLVSLTLGTGLASAAELVVSWDDNSAGEASFRVERRTPHTAFATLARVPQGVTWYRDTAVADGATYCYRVKAYGDSGESGYSEEACGSPTGSPYTVSVKKIGTGTGVVVSTPGGIECGTDCVEPYASGKPVTLVAKPASGSTFDGWSGACVGQTTCTVAANGPVAVTAKFSALVDLQVSRSGDGTVRSYPSGITCGADCQGAFGTGAQVTLTARPSDGFVFAGWSGGGCSGSYPICTVTLKATTAVSAMFRMKDRATLTTSPAIAWR